MKIFFLVPHGTETFLCLLEGRPFN
jgi:hypothetical protein